MPVTNEERKKRQREAQARYRAKLSPEDRGKKQQRWNKKNPHRHLKWRYGITKHEKDALFISQGSKCKICDAIESTQRWHIDHDHKTNKIRGILCFRCNHLLGNARDDVNVLRNAMNYLLGEPTMRSEEVICELLSCMRVAIKSGDWKVDGSCDPGVIIRRAEFYLAENLVVCPKEDEDNYALTV